MMQYEPSIIQLFSIAMLPAAFFIRLWRHSVSTFIFVVIASGCSFCAAVRGYNETDAATAIALVEAYLVFRAVMKVPQDKWFPGPRHHEKCDV